MPIAPKQEVAEIGRGPVLTGPGPLGQPPTPFPKTVAVVATVAALYFGRDILIPLSVAVLLTFALAPLVSLLRKIHIPRPPAIIAVVLGAFMAIFMFGSIVATQLGTLAQNLPVYQNNIETKVKVIKNMSAGTSVFERVSRLFERLGREIQTDTPPPGTDVVAPKVDQTPPPLPVQVVEPPAQALQVLQTVIGPLISPLATGGIVIVVVIFMLLKREDLRDRFIRLVGAGDLHRTTEALQDAGRRVGQYLLMQLIVNLTYAIPVGVGLWIIGVPNALLWGLMALVLRFIPYIGPIIASIFPLALSLAVDPGWTMVFWTIALFIVVEIITNNVVEPWLYGSRTGLSPVAIIVSAIFWTWLWGPIGLLLSTPLTVCLVVLGRHVPQFEFLDVLFGNEPVLEPRQQLYQRLLAGDPEEATDRAEAFLDDNRLVTFYETIAMPALALGELDRARGVMGEERRRRVAESALALVGNLEDYASEEAEEPEEEETEPLPSVAGSKAGEEIVPPIVLPDGTGRVVYCAGGRGELDDAAAAMLAQTLTAQAATAGVVAHETLEPGRLRNLILADHSTLIVVYLSSQSIQHARYMVRRLKRSRASVRIGVLFWNSLPDAAEILPDAAEIGCEFVAGTLTEAVTQALSEHAPSPLKRTLRKRAIARVRKTAAVKETA